MSMPTQESTGRIRLLLENWGCRARTNQKVHYDEAERLKHLHYTFGIPAIFLSALVGATMLVLIKVVGEDWVKILFGLLGFLAAFLSTLQTFLRFSERASEHRVAAVKMGGLNRKIERLLSLPMPPPDEAQKILEQLEEEINTVAEEIPAVPRRAWAKVPLEVTPSNAPISPSNQSNNPRSN